MPVTEKSCQHGLIQSGKGSKLRNIELTVWKHFAKDKIQYDYSSVIESQDAFKLSSRVSQCSATKLGTCPFTNVGKIILSQVKMAKSLSEFASDLYYETVPYLLKVI